LERNHIKSSLGRLAHSSITSSICIHQSRLWWLSQTVQDALCPTPRSPIRWGAVSQRPTWHRAVWYDDWCSCGCQKKTACGNRAIPHAAASAPTLIIIDRKISMSVLTVQGQNEKKEPTIHLHHAARIFAMMIRIIILLMMIIPTEDGGTNVIEVVRSPTRGEMC
jgi:hypothetical protein